MNCDFYTTNTSNEQISKNLIELISKIEEIKKKMGLTIFAYMDENERQKNLSI